MTALEQLPEPQAVYTLAEVAAALRVSSETIRRKIVAGELSAVEIGGTRRKQYRIFAVDLARWLGSERVAQLFGLGRALDELRAAFAEVPEPERESLIAEAVTWAKESRPAPTGPFLPTPTRQAILQKRGR